MQEASEKANLIEMKSGYHGATYKTSMNPPAPDVSKNQKPPQSSSKIGFSGGKFKKRKFDKKFKGSEQPKQSQSPQSVQSSKPSPKPFGQNMGFRKFVECFHCGQLGHYQFQCPNWDKPKVGPKPARSKETVGDSAKNHCIFATLDQKQAEQQNSVIEAQGNT